MYDRLVQEERVRSQLSDWLKRKIREYVGDDEPSLAEFILGKMSEHAAPEAMRELMQDILDADTKGFLLKLYRTIIYETLKWKGKHGG